MDAARQIVIETGELSPGALESAATFYARFASEVMRAIGGGANSVVLAMPLAPYDHTDWRTSAARDLARAHAPVRVNIIAGDSAAAIAAATTYLAGAPGITGQYLPLDSTGAGKIAE